MKERPILFSTPMVKALLEGRKTMTRRRMNFDKRIDNVSLFDEFRNIVSLRKMEHYKDGSYRAIFDTDETPFSEKCPYGKVGDVLWVRETWAKISVPDGTTARKTLTEYKADNKNWYDVMKWRPSIFMPREACRIRLEITDIRVERVREITNYDALWEGIEYSGTGLTGSPICYRDYLSKGAKFFHSYIKGKDDYRRYTAIDSYRTLWESINGKGSWDKNPWCWVISFKKL